MPGGGTASTSASTTARRLSVIDAGFVGDRLRAARLVPGQVALEVAAGSLGLRVAAHQVPEPGVSALPRSGGPVRGPGRSRPPNPAWPAGGGRGGSFPCSACTNPSGDADCAPRTQRVAAARRAAGTPPRVPSARASRALVTRRRRAARLPGQHPLHHVVHEPLLVRTRHPPGNQHDDGVPLAVGGHGPPPARRCVEPPPRPRRDGESPMASDAMAAPPPGFTPSDPVTDADESSHRLRHRSSGSDRLAL